MVHRIMWLLQEERERERERFGKRLARIFGAHLANVAEFIFRFLIFVSKLMPSK